MAAADGASSATIAARVALASLRQLERQGKNNQQLTPLEIDQHCRLNRSGETLLRNAMLRLHWSARAYYRVLRLARTIADLSGDVAIQPGHVAEAIQYRRALHEQ